MKIIYGTSNVAKVQQVEEFLKFKNIECDFLSLKDIGFAEEIIEDGLTFEENSMIKAKSIRNFCIEHGIKEIIVSDDAGICVDALNGAPGVYSARYAGDHAPQEITLNKLLNELKDVPKQERTAKFVCVLTAIKPDGKVIISRGETLGEIATKIGTLGKLTYGPVFIPSGVGKPMNDMTEEELANRLTHRDLAWLDLIERLK